MIRRYREFEMGLKKVVCIVTRQEHIRIFLLFVWRRVTPYSLSTSIKPAGGLAAAFAV